MMERSRIRSGASVVLAVFFLIPEFLLAQPNVDDAIRISRQGLMFNARSLGMGNAYSTIGYDFSALRMNPATMGLGNEASYTMSVNTNGSHVLEHILRHTEQFHDDQHNAEPGRIHDTLPNLIRPGVRPLRWDIRRIRISTEEGNTTGTTPGPVPSSPVWRRPRIVLPVLSGSSIPTYDNSGRYLGDQTASTVISRSTGMYLTAERCCTSPAACRWRR